MNAATFARNRTAAKSRIVTQFGCHQIRNARAAAAQDGTRSRSPSASSNSTSAVRFSASAALLRDHLRSKQRVDPFFFGETHQFLNRDLTAEI